MDSWVLGHQGYKFDNCLFGHIGGMVVYYNSEVMENKSRSGDPLPRRDIITEKFRNRRGMELLKMVKATLAGEGTTRPGRNLLRALVHQLIDLGAIKENDVKRMSIDLTPEENNQDAR